MNNADKGTYHKMAFKLDQDLKRVKERVMRYASPKSLKIMN